MSRFPKRCGRTRWRIGCCESATMWLNANPAAHPSPPPQRGSHPGSAGRAIQQRAGRTEAVLSRDESAASPEHRLSLAILQHALRCYQTRLNRADRRGRRLFRETAAWFAGNDATWPFSFEPICERLGIDPEYLRKGLERWRAAHFVVPIVTARRDRRPPPPARKLSIVARGGQSQTRGQNA